MNGPLCIDGLSKIFILTIHTSHHRKMDLATNT